MLELYGVYLLALGLALALPAYIWLLVLAFRQRLSWGLLVLFVPPLALLFALSNAQKSRIPLLLLLFAGFVCATPYALSYYERHFVRLAPHEQVVDGELRITLTGLQGCDYAALQGKRTAVVLQMANADVDDHTLDYLKGMDQLRALDLSGSRVSDDGLAALAGLPRLQELRLARTGITDEGFRKHVAPLGALRKLDVTGTSVKGKTLREWKNANPAERDYVN